MRIVVISQVPPPVHGSTVMTQYFLEQSAGFAQVSLIDRRFSRSAAEVGRLSLAKLLAVPSLLSRVLSSTFYRSGPAPTIYVHFVTNRPGSFLVDLALNAILRARRVKIVHYIHTVGFTDLADRNIIWEWAVRMLLRAADLTVCLGPRLSADVERWIPLSHIRHIANEVAVPRNAVRERKPVVLFLSNLLPEKGADDFLRVCSKIALIHPNLRFVIAGPGDRRQVDELVRLSDTLGVRDRVSFLGLVDSAEKWELLRTSTLLVFSSRYRYEAQPLTLVEAHAAGLQAVAYDIGGITDLTDDSEWLTTVPVKDTAALAEAALVKLAKAAVDSPPDTSSIAESGRYAREWQQALREVAATP